MPISGAAISLSCDCHGGLGRGHRAGTQQGSLWGVSGHSFLHPVSSGWRRQGVLGNGQGTHLSSERQADAQGAFWARSVNGSNSRASWVLAGSCGDFVNFGQFEMK